MDENNDLVDRLRGIYKVGPDGEYEPRDFSKFLPPIHAEAADRIEYFESLLSDLVHTFEAEAVQQKKASDGSGETAIWTDGLLVGVMDSPADNLTPIRLKAGKRYRVTVSITPLDE